MGNGLERAYLEKFFIISGYNIRKPIWILLVLIQNETKALQNAKIKDYSKKGDPWGDSDCPKPLRIENSPLSVIPTKKQWAY